MIRFILRFLRIVFILFLFSFFMIKIHYFLNKKLYNNYYPTILDYYYYKVDEEHSNEKYNEKDYIITKKEKELNINDEIIYLENNKVSILEIREIKDDVYLCTNNNYEKEIDSQDENIKGKIIYTNSTISKILNIMTNPIVVIFMMLYAIFIEQITFKRFKL